MDVYIYQADCHCEDCGDIIREELISKGAAPDDIDNESTYDSDEFPKGPYCEGGGEADTPQHCGTCGVFMDNPLTGDGYRYVREAVAQKYAVPTPDPDDGCYEYARVLAEGLRAESKDVLALWVESYPEAYDKANGGPL